jgi:large subunit ribosomal protein L6
MRIPKGVELRVVKENEVYVKGPQGVQKAIVRGVRVEGGEVEVEGQVSREVVKKLIQGVTQGYKQKIKINGVGYKAQVGKEGEVELSLGYKDVKVVKMAGGVEVKVEGNGTIITGRSQIYGELRQSLSKIVEQRSASKDRYKGKGVVK